MPTLAYEFQVYTLPVILGAYFALRFAIPEQNKWYEKFGLFIFAIFVGRGVSTLIQNAESLKVHFHQHLTLFELHLSMMAALYFPLALLAGIWDRLQKKKDE